MHKTLLFLINLILSKIHKNYCEEHGNGKPAKRKGITGNTNNTNYRVTLHTVVEYTDLES